MPATDYQGSSAPFASLGRSILSIRRDQVHSMDAHPSDSAEELESFQRHISDLFANLASSPDEILSLAWIRKLLEGFLVSLEEFRVIMFNHRSAASRPPLERHVAEFYERAVKALDVCNAVRDGVNQIRQWNKHVEIVVHSLSSLEPNNQNPGSSETNNENPSKRPSLTEGQLRRSKKTLMDLIFLITDEKDQSSSTSHRNRSFGRAKDSSRSATSPGHVCSGSHFRSLSWSVSRTWSAARQLSLISANLSAPSRHDISSTAGLVIPVYTISTVLLFTMWALVAAIPCQDRGLQIHFSIPRTGFLWSSALLSLHERITEESKRKERRNCSGLLKEIYQIEKSSHVLMELLEGLEVREVGEEREREVGGGVREMREVFEVFSEELEPLEKQIREVFHRIVRSRTESMDSLATHGHE
ncbi:hypothetical protein LUZ60_007486 [Juncus effusus]|nr:hypothetical protein LUZ60_007486 [Juncus effusus]